MNLNSAKSLVVLSAITLGANVSLGDDEFENLIPLQIMMGAMYEDTWALSNLLGPQDARFFMPFNLSPGNISYSIAAGTVIGDACVGLNGWMNQVDEFTWIGGSALDVMRATRTRTYDATMRREDDGTWTFTLKSQSADDPDDELLHGWTLTPVKGKPGAWTSTHSTGATDNVLRHVLNRVTWEITFPQTASVSGSIAATGATSGDAACVIPAPSTLAILGLALIASRRRR
ncbi:MAG: PEP-CTERM sorting domain-containing protein [Phycisphaerales bacterium]|nr:PEP-CTERM sorting domain-containing protein [Phycisphaerales bacterium]